MIPVRGVAGRVDRACGFASARFGNPLDSDGAGWLHFGPLLGEALLRVQSR